MTGWQKQAGKKTARCVMAAACLFVIATCGPALAQSVGLADGAPAAPYSATDRAVIWQILLAGFIVVAFLVSIALWVAAALRRVRYLNLRRESFVTSALNNLSQGILMVNAQQRVAFCNNRYLELYGLTRADIHKDMTGQELAELRYARGTLGCEIDEHFRNAAKPDGYISELKDGRSIHVKHTWLPNGGLVATHEDCTEQRRMSRELARAKTRLIADVVYSQDNQMTLARWYGVALTTGSTVDDVRRWPDRVRAVTAEQVQEAARLWLDKRRSVTGYLVNDKSPLAEKAPQAEKRS